MTAVSQGRKIEQNSSGLAALANPGGRSWYVNSTSGIDGNPGDTPLYPLLTLTQALTKAEAGDTIFLNPGGSETVTATLAVAVANLKIVCPVTNTKGGFTVTGAGTLALMTVSAANVHVEGVAFAHTGATGSAAGILTTNAADGLTVRKCLFTDAAIVTTFTGIGVDVTNACDNVVIEDCRFLDQKWGVKFTVATGVVCSDPAIRRCEFYVGKSAAFGIASVLTGTGIVQGLIVQGCLFKEACGSGAVATVAWDGTNGANATQGPIKLEAAVDQFLVTDCRAYSAANYSFKNLVSNAGAGDITECATGSVVAGDIDAIYSDTTAAAVTLTAIDSDITIIKSDTTAIHIQTTAIYSDTNAAATSLTAIYSDTNAAATTLAAIDSDVTIIKSDTTHIESDAVVIEAKVTTIASDLVLMQAGYPVMKVGTAADIAGIPNNSQAAGGLLATATGGAVLIEDVVISKDATALTGPTNIRISTDNVYGDTGVADPVAAVAVASVAATTRVAALGTVVWSTLKLPFVLEAGKKLYIDGDNSAGTSAGNYQYCVFGRAQNASTTLV